MFPLGSNPPLSANKIRTLNASFFVAEGDLNRERANLFACSPLGEKTVRCTVLRVWSSQNENPPLSAKKERLKNRSFFIQVVNLVYHRIRRISSRGSVYICNLMIYNTLC